MLGFNMKFNETLMSRRTAYEMPIKFGQLSRKNLEKHS